jgi:hypothetical protein
VQRGRRVAADHGGHVGRPGVDLINQFQPQFTSKNLTSLK